MPKRYNLGNLKKYVVAFLVIGVVGTIGLSILGSVEESVDNRLNVDGESFNSTSDPYTYTVAEASDSNFKELTSVTVYDSTGETNELTASITDAENGKVEVNGSNSDGDLEVVDYEYLDYDEQAQEGAGNSIEGLNETLGFLPVIGLVVAAAAVISIVTGFGNGKSKGRY